MKAAKVKGGPVEETLMYNSWTYSKIRIFQPRTEDKAVVLGVLKKKTEFLTAKHFQSLKNWEAQFLKGKHGVTGKEKSNFAVC